MNRSHYHQNNSWSERGLSKFSQNFEEKIASAVVTQHLKTILKQNFNNSKTLFFIQLLETILKCQYSINNLFLMLLQLSIINNFSLKIKWRIWLSALLLEQTFPNPCFPLQTCLQLFLLLRETIPARIVPCLTLIITHFFALPPLLIIICLFLLAVQIIFSRRNLLGTLN